MANNSNAVGKRSQEESLRTQVRILDKAEHLFSRLGFGGVSMREIARATGVHHHTIQHHYGSKEELYEMVLNRWDEQVEQLLINAIGKEQNLEEIIRVVVDQLFDFMLDKRDWVALTARAAIGADQPKRVQLKQHSWVQFMDNTLRDHKLGALGLDLGLLMITVEGILNSHILAEKHYRDLYGKNLDNMELRAKTKAHLQKVLSALVRQT
jgi:AcrR family transcriptional regulator